jgi:hypothetical protein
MVVKNAEEIRLGTGRKVCIGLPALFPQRFVGYFYAEIS